MSIKSNKRRFSKRKTRAPIRFDDTICDIGKIKGKNSNEEKDNSDIEEQVDSVEKGETVCGNDKGKMNVANEDRNVRDCLDKNVVSNGDKVIRKE